MSRRTLESLVALNLARGVGPTLHRRLVETFGSIEAALGKSEATLQKVKGIGPVVSRNILAAADPKKVQAEFDLAEKLGCRVLAFTDPDFPEEFRALPDAPIILYCKGERIPQDRLAIAVIGTRRSTLYGTQQAERLSRQLAERGVTVVSGLARGIDTVAHKGALKAGRTIAVLGSGIGRIYPPENRKLAEQIALAGCVFSEVPMTGAPDPQNFPRRNRLVSALSLGVLVVEAPVWSGAMITVEWALEHNKEVFAIPGRVDSPASQGCHALLKDGACLVENVEDILAELQGVQDLLRPAPAGSAAARAEPIGLSSREQALWNALTQEVQGVEELMDATQLPPNAVLAGLLALEMKHLAVAHPGKKFTRGPDAGARE